MNDEDTYSVNCNDCGGYTIVDDSGDGVYIVESTCTCDDGFVNISHCKKCGEESYFTVSSMYQCWGCFFEKEE